MKVEFEHTLDVDDIIVRQDAETDSDWIETVSGQIYPLIRIKDMVVEFPDIVDFNLSCGLGTILPKLSITIDDSEGIFTESNQVVRGDIMTIYVGNPRDTEHKPIKANYYVLETTSTPDQSNITFSCQLHVPLLWTGVSRGWVEKSTIEIIREIVKECGLGFSTNIDSTDDLMNRIQHKSNIQTILDLVETSFIDAETYIVCYIDQWCNFNLVDVNKGINAEPDTELTTQPLTGVVLEQPKKLILSNSFRDGGDGEDDNPDPLPKISNWSIGSNYGITSGKFVNSVVVKDYNLLEKEEIEFEQTEQKEQLSKVSTLTAFSEDSTFEAYHLARATNINNQQLLQGIRLSTTLEYYIPVIYNGMTIPLEIWNTIKNERNVSQDENVGNDEIEDVEPTGGESVSYNLNERYSKNAFLMSMIISYRKGVQRNSTNRVRQNLKFYIKDE